MKTLQLFHKTYGTGQPLVILHGLFGSHTNWQQMGRKLGQYFKTYTLDLRNHGNSPHSPDMDYSSMAADVQAFFRADKISDAIVLGHSMGGKVATQFTAVCPERVSKLVVVDISPFSDSREIHVGTIHSLIDLDLTPFKLMKEVVEALEPAIPSLAIRHFLTMNLARDANQAFYWKINLQAIAANLDKIGRKLELDGPLYTDALFLRGGNSDFITDDAYTLIKTHIPDASLTTIQSAGHWVHIDAPDAFMEALIVFSGP